MKARWTDKALFRLQQIHDYIAQDQPGNAQRFVDRLTRRAEAIAQVPFAPATTKLNRLFYGVFTVKIRANSSGDLA